MPANVPPEMEDKFKRCKEHVMARGESEEAAYGICYNAVVKADPEAIAAAAKHGFIMGEYAAVVAKAETYGGVERKDLKDSDFVFPDERVFPVMTAQDVHDAVSSWGRYKGSHSFEEFKSRLTALAHRKGLGGALPAEWKQAGKFSVLAVKAVGDWELDVLAAPYGEDSDRQTFDDGTDFMPEAFSQPAIIYHHGVMPGKGAIQKKPTIIGKALWMEKQADGLHVRVLLDKTVEWARKVWEAAKAGLAVASSDSIGHLARLEVSGKLRMYEKGTPGRIAVWPLAGISLWDKVPGNFLPASRYALALPAVKAIYKEAGLPFPETIGSHGDLPYTDEAVAGRADKKEIIKRARTILAKTKEI